MHIIKSTDSVVDVVTAEKPLNEAKPQTTEGAVITLPDQHDASHHMLTSKVWETLMKHMYPEPL